MPKSDTEIPHLAFTHHRIGIHKDSDRSPTDTTAIPRRLAELQPVHDLSRLPPQERQASLGLACLEVANRQPDGELAQVYRERALQLLQTVRGHGNPAQETVINAALTRLMFDLEHEPIEPIALAAYRSPMLHGRERCDVLFVLADGHVGQGDPAGAVAFARELVTLRRRSIDWLLLADCERVTGGDNIRCLKMSVRINPHQPKVHRFLADYYRRSGDSDRASFHELRTSP
ncbi:MAG: hypothetical protein B7Z55_17345 [Planctomycetales bacterium 12-60-4]|nr:MAG: hypothetical protein B7Z55_17345 [Planctomycetales bacterium 12-60-4]